MVSKPERVPCGRSMGKSMRETHPVTGHLGEPGTGESNMDMDGQNNSLQ